jgi:hypothetical protein
MNLHTKMDLTQMEHEIRVYVWEKPTNIVKCDEIVGLLREKYDEN